MANILALFEKLINEHGSSTILKERLELFRDLLEKSEAEKGELERELQQTRAELDRMRASVTPSAFVEFRGVRFKRKPSGGFEPTVYCPSCNVGMATTPSGNMPYVCGKCHSLSGFNSNELSGILRELVVEFPA